MPFTGPYPTVFAGNTPAMVISATTFSGGVTNTGTIGSGGISVVSGAFLSGGGILDSGIITGGVKVDSSSKIVATGAGGSTAIVIANTGSFGGGISNAGTLSATNSGIFVNDVSVFTGGIINSGTIAARFFSGILILATSTFSGGISNLGKITANGTGISLADIVTFSGGITNSGTVFATSRGIALGVKPGFLFTGDLANAGKISAATGIGVGVATVRGAIVDSGTINATNKGILVDGGVVSGGIQVSSKGKIFGGSGVIVENTTTFAGGITNGGTISVATHAIIVTSLTAFAGGVTNSGKISIAGGSRQQYCECYWWCQQQRHYIGTQDRHSDRKCRAFRHWERGRWRQQQRRDHREDRHLDLEQHC
jgi:hypothetical protein